MIFMSKSFKSLVIALPHLLQTKSILFDTRRNIITQIGLDENWVTTLILSPILQNL